MNRASEALRFAEDTRPVVVAKPEFGLVVTHTGDSALWAPFCAANGSIVAVAGRPVFDECDWDARQTTQGTGGLAAGILYRDFQRLGVEGLEQVNGSCAVIVYDKPGRVIHLVTDRCGVFPVYEAPGPAYCSHPDVLASAVDEAHCLDEASLAEFIVSGTVTPPFTYYTRIRAAEFGTVFSFDLSTRQPTGPSKRRYFAFAYRGDSRTGEDELAAQLATALRRAVQRRTQTRLGRTAIALSGGLDSRVIAACSSNVQQSFAFCCYDQPNRELRIADAIAQSLSVPFAPFRREPDYYADHAEQGVRISGGMGSLANNHFLGVIPRLKDEGIENLLTGCYCDYLFKALPLNRHAHWLTGREQLAPFRHQFYFKHFEACGDLALLARDRWESRVPRQAQAQDTPSAVFDVEAARTFPLCYEGDNQQRLVPQRLMGWSPPFVDRDVIDLYCRLPYQYKLNRSIFRRVVGRLPAEVSSIPDANTGAAANASQLSEWVRRRALRVRRAAGRAYRSSANQESWPNWKAYVLASPGLDRLWKRRNDDALALFHRVLGPSRIPNDLRDFKRREPFLFVGMLTLKLWLDQRK